MNRRILLLSSEHTGHGHKSIAQSLTSYLNELDATVDVRTANAFEFFPLVGSMVEKSYIPLITHAPCLWGLFFAWSHRFPRVLNWFSKQSMEARFIALVRDYRPDLIVSVHPGFVGCVIDLLDKHGLRIPFVSLIADLVTFSSLWVDKRSCRTISPTEEATQKLLALGLPAEAAPELGFPIRRRFETPAEVFTQRIERRNAGAPLGILVFANAFPKNRTRALVRTLLGIEGTRITVITGRDDRLKDSLASAFPELLATRVRLPGYVTDMERHMAENDLLITRAGPNTLLESVSCGLPLIITGHVPGQEAGNPGWIERRGLGITCRKIPALPGAIADLLANNSRRWLEIAERQRAYATRVAGRDTAAYLLQLLAESNAPRV
ncbi:MAG TPA: glycosyltransferase [Opitutaceae bacterium]|nr:glycosyltransferase [Opitutaceae bacterium]